MSVRFTLKRVPALRVDLRGVTPAALHDLSTARIERLTVTHGMQTLALLVQFEDTGTLGPGQMNGLSCDNLQHLIQIQGRSDDR